jgi:GT2 family glycosyltransferase
MKQANDEPKPDVIIGVLTWNGYELARACIESLATLRQWPVPVFICDNGSREPEGERLALEFGEPVRAVTLPVNELVAGGYNALMRAAAESAATYILLLNNDTVVTDPSMLDKLIAVSGQSVAAVGPRVLNENGTHFSGGGTLGRWSGRSGHMRRNEMPFQDRPFDVPWIDGPCMLINVKAACEVRGFDPVFVSTWEELDWCVRARKLGFRCVVEPRATIRHLRGRTIPSSQSQAYLLRNAILFARRHAGWPEMLTAGLTWAFYTVPEQGSANMRRLRGLLTAAWTAVRWNASDAVARRAWRRPAWGPSICDHTDDDSTRLRNTRA